MDRQAVKKLLHDFIVEEVLLRDDAIADDEDLFDAGFDSMSLSRILVFVEEKLGVTIPDEDVVIDDIATLEGMTTFVVAYLSKA